MYTVIETPVYSRPLRDWKDAGQRQESENTLRPKGIRVLTYSELIKNAEKAYQSYVDESRSLQRQSR